MTSVIGLLKFYGLHLLWPISLYKHIYATSHKQKHLLVSIFKVENLSFCAIASAFQKNTQPLRRTGYVGYRLGLNFFDSVSGNGQLLLPLTCCLTSWLIGKDFSHSLPCPASLWQTLAFSRFQFFKVGVSCLVWLSIELLNFVIAKRETVIALMKVFILKPP